MKLTIWSIVYRDSKLFDLKNGICVDSGKEERYFSIDADGELREIKFSFDVEYKHLIEFNISSNNKENKIEK